MRSELKREDSFEKPKICASTRCRRHPGRTQTNSLRYQQLRRVVWGSLDFQDLRDVALVVRRRRERPLIPIDTVVCAVGDKPERRRLQDMLAQPGCRFNYSCQDLVVPEQPVQGCRQSQQPRGLDVIGSLGFDRAVGNLFDHDRIQLMVVAVPPEGGRVRELLSHASKNAFVDDDHVLQDFRYGPAVWVEPPPGRVEWNSRG
jgi:hypothetical protein